MNKHRQRQWMGIYKQEQRFLRQYAQESTDGFLHKLEEKVPDTLRNTLQSGFSKGFSMVFDQGTPIIEKTFSKAELQHQFQVDDYALHLKEGRKAHQRFTTKVSQRVLGNAALSGVKGVGLGVLGIGLPDIPVLVGTLLKGLYEIATQYGFDYDTPQERYFILLLIKTAMTTGDQLSVADDYVNKTTQTLTLPPDYDQSRFIEAVAQTLSTSLLAAKFLQGIALVGVVGGAYDAITVQRVLRYGALKYQRRYLCAMEAEVSKI